MNAQVPQPLSTVTARERKISRSAETSLNISTKITKRDINQENQVSTFLSYLKNPFILAVATWVIIAVLFLLDVIQK